MTIPTLTTARLSLRPFVAADAPTVRRLAGEREVSRTTLNIPHPYPEGAAEQWIASLAPAFVERTGAAWAIVHAGDLVGTVSLGINPQDLVAELGYWIGVPWWNRGIATEAADAVVHYGFAHLGLRRIQSRHLTSNPASGAVMRKIGMRPEGRHELLKGGVSEEVQVYGLLATDAAPANRTTVRLRPDDRADLHT